MLQHQAVHFIMNKLFYTYVCIDNTFGVLPKSTKCSTLQNHRKQAQLMMFKIVKDNLTVLVWCLPLPSTLAYTHANHSIKYAHLQIQLRTWMSTDILLCPEQFHNYTISYFKDQLRKILNLSSIASQLVTDQYVTACYLTIGFVGNFGS